MNYCIVASTNTYYYSENQVLGGVTTNQEVLLFTNSKYILLSRIPTCPKYGTILFPIMVFCQQNCSDLYQTGMRQIPNRHETKPSRYVLINMYICTSTLKVLIITLELTKMGCLDIPTL